MNMFGAALLVFVACLTTANCDFNSGLLHVVAANPNTAEAGTHDGQRFALQLEEALGSISDSGQRFFNGAVHVHTNNGHVLDASNGTSSNNAMDGHLFVEAQKLLDKAAHVWDSEEETDIRRELSLAMRGETTFQVPDSAFANEYPADPAPDFSKCPSSWVQRGSMCYVDNSHQASGPCGSPIDLASMSTEQKIAFERFCNVEFPPLSLTSSCAVDFAETCPNQWREVAKNVCQAPDNYRGNCNELLDTSEMTTKDKHNFAIKCGARWPCVVAPSRNYQPTCPSGWRLQSGSVCAAPPDYTGVCANTSDMGGLSIAEKQHFEELCNVSWPSARAECKRDYNANCPYGWRGGANGAGAASCTAPSTFTSCSRVQSFAHMTPWEKREWEHACNAPFPCIDRSGPNCDTEWSAPCPAEWLSVDDGRTCVAPAGYSGNCAKVLHGLAELVSEEKHAVARSCSVSWPCFGEVSSI